MVNFWARLSHKNQIETLPSNTAVGLGLPSPFPLWLEKCYKNEHLCLNKVLIFREFLCNFEKNKTKHKAREILLKTLWQFNKIFARDYRKRKKYHHLLLAFFDNLLRKSCQTVKESLTRFRGLCASFSFSWSWTKFHKNHRNFSEKWSSVIGWKGHSLGHWWPKNPWQAPKARTQAYIFEKSTWALKWYRVINYKREFCYVGMKVKEWRFGLIF